MKGLRTQMEKTRGKKSVSTIFQGSMDKTVTMTELISQHNRLSRDAPTRTFLRTG